MKDKKGINIILDRIITTLSRFKKSKNKISNNATSKDSFKIDTAYCFLVSSGVLNISISSIMDNRKLSSLFIYLTSLQLG